MPVIWYFYIFISTFARLDKKTLLSYFVRGRTGHCGNAAIAARLFFKEGEAFF
jgi:hypothetical protein